MSDRETTDTRIMFDACDSDAGSAQHSNETSRAEATRQHHPNEHLLHLQAGGFKRVFGCFNVIDGQALHGAGLSDTLPIAVEIGPHVVDDHSNGVKLLAVEVYLEYARARLNFREDKIREVISGLVEQLEYLQDEDRADQLDVQVAYQAERTQDQGIIQLIGFSQKSWENTGNQMIAYVGHAIQGRAGLLVRGDRGGVPSPKEEGQIVWRLVHVFRNESGRSATAIVANDPEYLRECLTSLRRQLSAAQKFNMSKNGERQGRPNDQLNGEAKCLAKALRRAARRA